nr:hypothetical protein [Tanacetum cinerariifolium]
MLLEKLPKKLGDPGKFIIPCDFPGMDGSDFILEEIEAYLKDESISPEIDQTDCDPKGDICLIEKLLNNDPFQLSLVDLKQGEVVKAKSLIEEPSELELKNLPSRLKYAYLEGFAKLPMIIAKDLKDNEKEALLKVLKSHKRAIAWKITDIKGIDPRFCTHKILMEEDYKPAMQSQRRVNPKIYEVIKKEVIKLLDAGMIYPISDSLWEKTTFTYPCGTFAYRRMPFGLCNAPGTFQRYFIKCRECDIVMLMKKIVLDWNYEVLFRSREESLPSEISDIQMVADMDTYNDGVEYQDYDSVAESDDLDMLELCESGEEFCRVGDHTCSVPFELYDLPDLRDILSMDVWNYVLNDDVRFSLAKHLPDMDEEMLLWNMKELFACFNFHFGVLSIQLFNMLKGGLCEPRVALYRNDLGVFQKRHHYHVVQSTRHMEHIMKKEQGRRGIMQNEGQVMAVVEALIMLAHGEEPVSDLSQQFGKRDDDNYLIKSKWRNPCLISGIKSGTDFKRPKMGVEDSVKLLSYNSVRSKSVSKTHRIEQDLVHLDDQENKSQKKPFTLITPTHHPLKMNKMPYLTVQEIVNRVKSNPGDPQILKTYEPLHDLVRGSLRIFSIKATPFGVKGWKSLVFYEKSIKSWSWVGPLSQNQLDQYHEAVNEATSPDAWGLPHRVLVKLVGFFANWLTISQGALHNFGSLPAPPITLMQVSLSEKERFTGLNTQKKPDTIMQSSKEVKYYFRKEELIRYLMPDRAFAYGKKSTVAPITKGPRAPTSKVRNHFMLKQGRPSDVSILCLVRDATTRLPEDIGTRADVCTLIRDSQKLWVYLHRERGAVNIEDDRTLSTKRWKRQKNESDINLVHDMKELPECCDGKQHIPVFIHHHHNASPVPTIQQEVSNLEYVFMCICGQGCFIVHVRVYLHNLH